MIRCVDGSHPLSSLVWLISSSYLLKSPSVSLSDCLHLPLSFSFSMGAEVDCGECNNGTRGGVSLCHPSNPSELCVSWLIPLTLIHSDTLLCLDEPAVNTADGGGVRRGEG